MSQHYLNARDERDPHKLSDLEIFYQDAEDLVDIVNMGDDDEIAEWCKEHLPDVDVDAYIKAPLKFLDLACSALKDEAGWYYRFCFPGCMPESEADGPYGSEAEALEAARDQHADWDDELDDCDCCRVGGDDEERA